MIRSFANKGTEDIYDDTNSKEARRTLPRNLWEKASHKMDLLDTALVLKDLQVPIGNRLESLSGNRAGQHSIRINDQYRICFAWTKEGPTAVEIVDYHP